jgi:hypothetical protein
MKSTVITREEYISFKVLHSLQKSYAWLLVSERICPSGGGIGRVLSRFGVSVRPFSWNWSVRNGKVLGESSTYFCGTLHRLSTGRKRDWHVPDAC